MAPRHIIRNPPETIVRENVVFMHIYFIFEKSLVALYRVGRTRFGEGVGQLDRRRVRGVLNPCARDSKARTGRFLREKLISDHSLVSSYEGQQGVANGQDSWGFSGMHRSLDDWMLACAPALPAQMPPPPWTPVFQFSLFLYSVWS